MLLKERRHPFPRDYQLVLEYYQYDVVSIA